MENRIPIDDLFHDKLRQGREQVNLGAWANMERMLDGKNPYIDEERKKRRGFLPFWILLLVTTGIAGAGYLLRSGNTEKESQNAKPTAFVTNNSVNNTTKSQVYNLLDNGQHEINRQSSNAITSASTNNNITSSHFKNSNKKALDAMSDSFAPEANKAQANTQKASIVIDNESQGNSDNVNSLSKVMGSNRKNSKGDIQSGKKSKRELNKLDTDNNSIAQNKAAISDGGANFLGSSLNASTDKIIEKLPMVTINQRVDRNRDGSIKQVIDDTIGQSVFEKVTNRSTNGSETASLDPTITNPRFRKLNEEEEHNVNQQIENKQENSIAMASTSVIQSSSSHNEISIASQQKTKVIKHTGYFDDLRKFASDAYRKLSNYMLYSPKPDVYTGLNMGVNASLSNSKNNFGGFQGGFVLLRPINDYFSFITECKFYYRQNSGYTINDISYEIKDTVRDNFSLIHSTIYSYRKDSSVRTFNFKNFYSIELPLMAQLNYRAWALYGGVNIAYNFKLKTTEKNKDYTTIYRDTLGNNEAYTFPIGHTAEYSRNDFSSRFGLGYTVGAAYNFSPQLYLDMRIAQNVWDNTKTNSAREISNGFFKVPSVQISLGYRFRKFTPDN